MFSLQVTFGGSQSLAIVDLGFVCELWRFRFILDS